MGYVGSGTLGKVFTAQGNGASSTFKPIGSDSGLTANGVLVAQGTSAFTVVSPSSSSVLLSTAGQVPTWASSLTNGQVIIGSTGATPVAATLTAGTGISISTGAGSITINATTGGFTWTDVTSATQALDVENGYFTDRGGGVTYTLPATAALGDVIKIDGKLGLTTIAQNANQSIRIGSSISTVGVGGSVVGTNLGDCITLRCSTAGASTVWIAESTMGNWVVN